MAMKATILFLWVALAGLLLAACGQGAPPAAGAADTQSQDDADRGRSY
jgi:hypothetical protein